MRFCVWTDTAQTGPTKEHPRHHETERFRAFRPRSIETRGQSRAARSRSALPMTETDERLIAAAANIGEIKRPKNG